MIPVIRPCGTGEIWLATTNWTFSDHDEQDNLFEPVGAISVVHCAKPASVADGVAAIKVPAPPCGPP
jgi:hypothetical protein